MLEIFCIETFDYKNLIYKAHMHAHERILPFKIFTDWLIQNLHQQKLPAIYSILLAIPTATCREQHGVALSVHCTMTFRQSDVLANSGMYSHTVA